MVKTAHYSQGSWDLSSALKVTHSDLYLHFHRISHSLYLKRHTEYIQIYIFRQVTHRVHTDGCIQANHTHIR